jgi:1-acyl-sn-glycerol-3-phosphate acyltransferase
VLFLRSLLFNILFFTVTALTLILALPVMLVHYRYMLRMGRGWAYIVFFLLRVIVGARWEVRGPVEKLQGPALVVAKHQSAWDTIVFFVLCDSVTYVMKKELLSIPVYGWCSKHMGHIAIDRTAGISAMRQLIRDVKAALADNRSIILFPQGTRVAPGAEAPYQPGVVALYDGLKIPVVPVALNFRRELETRIEEATKRLEAEARAGR